VIPDLLSPTQASAHVLFWPQVSTADDDREEGQYEFDEERPEIVFSEQMLGMFGYLFNAIVHLPINLSSCLRRF
jgi:hypothetical protein